MKEEQIKELYKIRNYFGEHDKTSFEHLAYSFLDKLIKEENTSSEANPFERLVSGLPKWMPLQDVLEIVCNKTNWGWINNTRCKYIDIHIDMRDNTCLLFDREGKEITLHELKHQNK